MIRLRLLYFALLGTVCLAFRASEAPSASAYWAEVIYSLHQYHYWADTTQGNVLTLRSSISEVPPIRRVLSPLNSSPTYFGYTLCNSFAAFRQQLNVPYNQEAESQHRYAIHYGPLLQAAGLTPVVQTFRLGWGKELVGFYNTEAQYEVTHLPIAQYNSAALQQMFNRLYPAPGTTISGIPSQQVYNVVFKHYIRGLAHIWSVTLANGAIFKQKAQEYADGAFAADSTGFDGFVFAEEQTPAILGAMWTKINALRETAIRESNTENLAYVYVTRLVGILLRRQIDGTLPTVLGCLKRVLKDYDPEAYAQYGSQLVLN